MGAKLTSEFRSRDLITKIEGERLMAFTNNSGPIFILGAVATGMLNMPQIGFLLLACHLLSALTVGILFSLYKKKACKKDNMHIKIIENIKKT
jgi:nucleoside recognition membrane protein YjiH